MRVMPDWLGRLGLEVDWGNEPTLSRKTRRRQKLQRCKSLPQDGGALDRISSIDSLPLSVLSRVVGVDRVFEAHQSQSSVCYVPVETRPTPIGCNKSLPPVRGDAHVIIVDRCP